LGEIERLRRAGVAIEFALAETPAADIMQGTGRGDMGVGGRMRLLANNVSRQ
jgi:hypothetical protein